MKQKGQVSIEALLLAAVIIFMGVSVFGYYIQIKDSTTGMEAAKIEALRQVSQAGQKVTIERIEYKYSPAVGTDIRFCIFYEAEAGFSFDQGKLRNEIASLTAFEAAAIEIQENPVAGSNCE
jgi:hypothetical protein